MTPNTPTKTNVFAPDLIRSAFFLLIAMVMIRSAWVSDDAHIILRTLDNFRNGYGLTWNVSERVQAFTCPLWTLLLSVFYAVTGEGYYTTIVLSLAVSLCTVYFIAARLPTSALSALCGMTLLLLSRAFIDYSTSGLENPLTHLLTAVYYIAATRVTPPTKELRRIFYASFVFALLVINRMDTALLLGPAHLYLVLKGQGRMRRVAALVLGCAPIFLWFTFSLFYYGFCLPNTAYAKLSTGIPSRTLFEQGLFYLRNSLFWDPITLSAVAVSLIAAVSTARTRRPLSSALGLGMILHLAYVTKVGGDHMAGRFLTPVFVVAVLLISTWSIPEKTRGIALIAFFVGVGFMGSNPTVLFQFKADNKGVDAASIADEREFCFPSYGLFYQSRETSLVNNYLGNRGTRHFRAGAHTIVDGHIGLFGYYAGPAVHLIDPLALTDPLLARLPIPFGKYWRTGHYAREIPAGYPDAVENKGPIEDPDLQIYYEHLKRIISGDLWSLDRFQEIILFNAGAYDELKMRYIRRSVGIRSYKELSRFERPDRVPWNEEDNIVLSSPGIGIRIPKERWEEAKAEKSLFSVSLSGGYRYDLLYLKHGNAVADSVIDLSEKETGFLFTYKDRPPKRALDHRVDLIRITPDGSTGKYGIGHFRFESAPQSLKLETLKENNGGFVFADRDIDILTSGTRHPRRLRLMVPENSGYHLTFFCGNEQCWSTGVVVDGWNKERIQQISIPPSVSKKGIDRIRVSPRIGNTEPRLEFLEFID